MYMVLQVENEARQEQKLWSKDLAAHFGQKIV